MNKVDTHLKIANLLMGTISETMGKWSSNKNDIWPYYGMPPEHSKESVIRRCIQVRQELLQVIKELR